MLHHHQSSPAKPSRVLILGSSGFMARDLVRHLGNHGIPHRAIGSREIDLLRPESVGQLQAEIREDDAIVITSGLTPEKGKDLATFMKNITMGQHLSNAMETTRSAHVIYVSSDAVYAWQQSLLREASCCQPSDYYSLMHIAREQMLSLTLAQSQIPLCIFRPCGIYGAGDTHNAYGPTRFLRSAIKDHRIALFGHGEETRDHVYIEDVSELLRLCLVHRSAGVINSVSGHAITFREVASKVCKLVDASVEIEAVPRGGPITHRQFDVTERIKAFPDFIATCLDEGLAATFRGLTSSRDN